MVDAFLLRSNKLGKLLTKSDFIKIRFFSMISNNYLNIWLHKNYPELLELSYKVSNLVHTKKLRELELKSDFGVSYWQYIKPVIIKVNRDNIAFHHYIYNDSFDQHKFNNASPANIIHFLDANLVHKCYNKLYKINKSGHRRRKNNNK